MWLTKYKHNKIRKIKEKKITELRVVEWTQYTHKNIHSERGQFFVIVVVGSKSKLISPHTKRPSFEKLNEKLISSSNRKIVETKKEQYYQNVITNTQRKEENWTKYHSNEQE